jgi:hypothetical protein
MRSPSGPPGSHFDHEMGKLLDEAMPHLEAMFRLAQGKAAEEQRPRVGIKKQRDRFDERLFEIAMLFWVKNGGEVNHANRNDSFRRFAEAIFSPLYDDLTYSEVESKIKYRIDQYLKLSTFSEISKQLQLVPKSTRPTLRLRNRK